MRTKGTFRLPATGRILHTGGRMSLAIKYVWPTIGPITG
jgi:hypothetical protein